MASVSFYHDVSQFVFGILNICHPDFPGVSLSWYQGTIEFDHGHWPIAWRRSSNKDHVVKQVEGLCGLICIGQINFIHHLCHITCKFHWYWHSYFIATTLRYVRYVMSNHFWEGRVSRPLAGKSYPSQMWIRSCQLCHKLSVRANFKGHQQVFRKHVYIHIHRLEPIY